VSTTGPVLDAARSLVVERDLVRPAFAHLTVDAFMELPFEALGPTKALLKRFFSSTPWTAGDDDALAAAVGPGTGRWRHRLEPDLVLEYGWEGGRFGVRVVSDAPVGPAGAPSPTGPPEVAVVPTELSGSFDGPVVPEATPNPRTIRFQVGPVHDGPSRWFASAGAVSDEDPGAARLFDEFAEVANVLVGADFIAVGLRRAADWERLLRPILKAVTEEYSSADAPLDFGPPRVMGGPAGAGALSGSRAGGRGPQDPGARRSRTDSAWHDLGELRPARADDLARVQAAVESEDASYRQVAANLLREADAAVAFSLWSRLVGDPVRSVRRAAVDAMVDVERQELRPLLEEALSDRDAWIRWKAMRGLVQLGPTASRTAIAAHADDPDFHVRLEAAAALSHGGSSSTDGIAGSPVD